jgi:hypothetical protein
VKKIIIAVVAVAAALLTSAPAAQAGPGNLWSPVQLCAKGTYPASFFINSTYTQTGQASGSLGSPVVQPGSCWNAYWGTLDLNAWVRVTGYDHGKPFDLGGVWFNSRNGGLYVSTYGPVNAAYFKA